jgi:DNA-binding response OmpR family regulator
LAERVGKILIIDDEESIRDGCRQILSREGYHIEETGNAVVGLEMALRDVYHVILLDVQMPKMNPISPRIS